MAGRGDWKSSWMPPWPVLPFLIHPGRRSSRVVSAIISPFGVFANSKTNHNHCELTLIKYLHIIIHVVKINHSMLVLPITHYDQRPSRMYNAIKVAIYYSYTTYTVCMRLQTSLCVWLLYNNVHIEICKVLLN